MVSFSAVSGDLMFKVVSKASCWDSVGIFTKGKQDAECTIEKVNILNVPF